MSDDLPAVLITGGAKRLGAAIARRFGEAGWHVVIHYGRSEQAARELADTLPSAETVACDFRDDDAAVTMISSLTTKLANWRCLINCASVFDADDVTALDPATNRKAMQINALTPARIAQTYLASAQASAGRCVINVTDQKLENPNPDFFSYTMSKHALNATIMMLSKARSHPEDRIYGLAPGAILASHDQTEAETDISHRLNLLQRKTRADEIADAALFLASGALTSGQTLFIDSGQHLLDQDRDVIYLARNAAG